MIKSMNPSLVQVHSFVIIKWSLFKLIAQFTRYIGGAVHISICGAIDFQQMVSLDTNLEFNLFYHFATLINLFTSLEQPCQI